MKLKGQLTKTLSKRQRKKMEGTLARMKKTRQVDNQYLREVLKQKLAWAMNERIKGENLIKKTQAQVYRLEGIEIFIKETLSAPTKKK